MAAAERPDQIFEDDPPALRTALAMLKAGLRPVPIHPGKKRPIGEGWGLRKHTAASLRAEWERNPEAGVGILLGDDGDGGGVIDFEVDDAELAKDVLPRIFPSGLPDTLRFVSNLGPHYLLRYDSRLAAYGQTIIKGWIEDGEVKGNGNYLGVEFRIGTIEPASPVQEQTVVPPTPRTDGTPRQWIGPGETLLIPEAAFDDLSRILPIPESVFDDLDRYAITSGLACEPVLDPPKPTRSRGTVAKAPLPQWGAEEVKRAILPSALDLVKGWGLEITGKKETAKGFIACRAFDRTDNDPSAGFNVRTGVYTDRKTGTDLSIFDLAVALRIYLDLQTAINSLGHQFKVPPKFAQATFATKASKGQRGTHHSGQNGAYYASVANVAYQNSEDPESMAVRRWPKPLGGAAYYGLAGEIVGAIAPHTESDPVAVLVQLLTGFGNLVGRIPYFAIEADRHYPNLFICLTGASSKARKGTSWGHVKRLLTYVDSEWCLTRILSGLSSGEGLIWAVRDPIKKREPVKDKGRVIDYQDVEVDAGVSDKRLLALEPELASPLKVLSREGNTLSALIRRAWDDGNLRTLTKNNPAVSTDAHISIVGHITRDEVERLLTSTEAANGFGNRFLWVCVRRSQSLPFGGRADLVDFEPLLSRLAHAAVIAKARTELRFDGSADELWLSVYDALAEGKPGLIGSILGRAEAQVVRLALIYALIDGAAEIGLPHLEAALAIWAYAEESAEYIFGDSLGDQGAYVLLDALKDAGGCGLTQTEICHDVFEGHKSREEISRSLSRLLEAGRVRSERDENTGGRPVTRWFALRDKRDKSERSMVLDGDLAEEAAGAIGDISDGSEEREESTSGEDLG